jgi:hypothetical protein
MAHSIRAKDLIFELVLPTDKQIFVLFQLLENRKHKISHSATPAYSSHNKFVKNNPYRNWYLVKAVEEYIGNFYITTENTIGININDESMRRVTPEILSFVFNNYEPLPSIPSVRGDQFAINVSPTNTKLADILEEIGCTVIQTTYLFPS